MLISLRMAVLGLVAVGLVGIGPARAAEEVLYRFTGGDDGSNPLPGTLLAYQDALYGTTNGGGRWGHGTVFVLTPPPTGETKWKETTLYSFAGDQLDFSYDGSAPMGALIAYNSALYGTTNRGGRWGYGTVFKLSPPASAGAAWTERVLYNFCSVDYSCSDGAYPQAALVAFEGALYGTTSEGGSKCYRQCGTVFRLDLPTYQGGPGKEKVIHSFGSGSDGAYPLADVIVYEGSLYGTTENGGSSGYGTVFQLTPTNEANTAWRESGLYSFAGSEIGVRYEGEYPVAGLVAYQGALFGTTTSGGPYCDLNYGTGCGTVFKVNPHASVGTALTGRAIHTFCTVDILQCKDGSTPAGKLLAYNGALYGTTVTGGTHYCFGQSWCGTIFKLELPAFQGGSGTESVLHSFTGGANVDSFRDGAFPQAGLIIFQGALVGASVYGGNWLPCVKNIFFCGYGTVFQLPLSTGTRESPT